MKEITETKKEMEDDSGLLYELFEQMKNIVTSYNDTVKGRCAVCLEQFCENEDQKDQQSFAEREDLVRVDTCYHRFHMICVYRDWFMQRKDEKDSYGGVIHFEIPEFKKCPICRREVEEAEITYVKNNISSHPDLDDGGYKY